MNKLPKNSVPAEEIEWHDNEKRHIRMGWAVVIFGFLGFFIWSAIAPLDKGVSSPGTVTVSGNRKEIQSPVSGVITDIAVKDGDTVKAGQKLIQLSQVHARAELSTLENQYLTAVATIDRLETEQENRESIIWSDNINNGLNHEQVKVIKQLQLNLFKSRRLSLQSNIDADKDSIEGYHLQLSGLKASILSKSQQLMSLRKQVESFKQLADEGFLPKNRYLEIQQQYSEAYSTYTEMSGRAGQISKQINELSKRIIQRSAEFKRDVQSELNQTKQDAEEYRNKLDIAMFELSKTEIKAPVEGVIVNQSVFTQGGTVSTGEHLFDIMPTQKMLVVNAQLQVDMIDKVHTGLPVELMFTAFNANKTPRIPGVVSMISADRLTDKEKLEPYYKMQVTVTPEGMELLKFQEIKPGMSVVVFVKTGSRSLLNYLFKPIVDRMNVSLSED